MSQQYPPFDPDCSRCPRLAAHLGEVAREHPGYHCRPVPTFGRPGAHLVIVGLAPGRHGANATGRPFTGDHAGILLYRTLYAFGFASGPESHRVGDGLVLHDCRITNAVKCLPPGNKPTAAEVRSCNPFLQGELLGDCPPRVVLALGGVAHRAVVRAFGCRQADYPFEHGQARRLQHGPWLLDSYHCSRYNTQTGRLTGEMFAAVFTTARRLLIEAASRDSGV